MPDIELAAEGTGWHPGGVIRSLWPDPVIPDVSLTSYVLCHADRLADKPALIDAASGRALSYGALAEQVRRVAAGLASRGFGRGDVLGLCLPNLPEFPVVLYAVASAGGATTTLNPLYTAAEMATQLRYAGARALVTIPACLDRAREAATRAGVSEVVVLGEAAGATSFESLLGAGAEPAMVDVDLARDPVLLPYSSGTTGVPKGVVLTHRNLVANLVQAKAPLPLGEGDTVLGVAPFFHSMGTLLLNLSLAQGATLVCLPRFELESFLRVLQDHRVTVTVIAPPIALALVSHPAVDSYNLSALRRVGVGAAPLPAEVERAVADRLACVVGQGYGLTESGPAIALAPTSEPERIRPGTVGMLVPGTQGIVVDPATGARLGPGDPGELWVRGPQMMAGYLRDPAATAATLDADGWLHTGDVCSIHADGYVRVVDRLKELIKYKGFPVAPAELEAVVLVHPCVTDAAVVGVPDEQAGEVPRACVVARGELDPDDLMAFVAARVAPHKRVRRVEIVEAIPRSPNGKVLRRLLAGRRERIG